ncbi:hypothetical protein HBI56_118250 [Parastagonospora nodorum]|uniref:Uncharacterized protein n=1 Tax=Phaeosphaeria nodorum (strain SN15 / ATCC MYA-4574 / FGSC 10173) TaxID=321614 RepID=A0A7U2FDZ2_PHANO|nr:hypothetical protein HBH56_056520 [Parastagonospora nodorum]QRD02484.1 hypothetical protein JI435_440920 [Parastagonospora nodorum SN15]KAH3921106.1 hypothetical protein HBH54_245730 [Parastagonospora nodorum]KAH3948789.1 hypothetical protein HBH53_097000 [Parastagonospora nodorum]KAH3956409.1 hypothetical protein HBH51_242130 [Parastagonospora nodorum]
MNAKYCVHTSHSSGRVDYGHMSGRVTIIHSSIKASALSHALFSSLSTDARRWVQPRGLLDDYRPRPASRVLWIAGSGGKMVPGICLPVWNLRFPSPAER